MRTESSTISNADDGRVLTGFGVCGGIAIGPAHVVERGVVQVPEYCLPVDQVVGELQRFAEAIGKSHRQIRNLRAKAQKLPESAAEEIGFLLDAHIAMLTQSRLTRGVERRIRDECSNAEAAVQAEIGAIVDSFAGTNDSFLAARIADVREVGTRLIRNLMEFEYPAFSLVPVGSIVVAEELSPAETALLDPQRIIGLVTMVGGAEGHTAIMARSLGVPTVSGVTGLLPAVRTGDALIVDGEDGRVLVKPSPAVTDHYAERRSQWLKVTEDLRHLADLPAVTRDGVDISLSANLDLPREVPGALAAGAVGVGLLRTEFLFMNRTDLPDEDEQYATLCEIVEGMQGRPVTIRTLDLGGDKLTQALGGRLGAPANPALGLRAVRLGLREPSLMETQLAAILRAGAHGPTRILLPLISTVEEVRQMRECLARVARRLKRRRARIADPIPELGVMIEVPGAALAADALAREADFFSIGTNDLTQYTLAIDRGDDQVAALYDPLHPAVLRLIQFTIEAALRAGLPVSICGEVAGDAKLTPLLLGLGVRDLSMAPNRIAMVKRCIRAMCFSDAKFCAEEIMLQTDSRRSSGILGTFAERIDHG